MNRRMTEPDWKHGHDLAVNQLGAFVRSNAALPRQKIIVLHRQLTNTRFDNSTHGYALSIGRLSSKLVQIMPSSIWRCKAPRRSPWTMPCSRNRGALLRLQGLNSRLCRAIINFLFGRKLGTLDGDENRTEITIRKDHKDHKDGGKKSPRDLGERSTPCTIRLLGN